MLLVLPLALALFGAAAPEANSSSAAPPAQLDFSVSAGFSGWANPLPNYPLVLQGRDDDSGAYFNDLSVTPLRIRVTNRGRANVAFTLRVWNHAPPLVTAALDAAREVETHTSVAKHTQGQTNEETDQSGSVTAEFRGRELSSGGSTFSTPTMLRQEKLIARKQRTEEFFVPLAVFPLQPDGHPVGIRVELSVQGKPIGEASTLVHFLPTGSVYSAIITREANNQILYDEVEPDLPPSAKASAANFYFKHGIVAVPYSMLGPNHTILRHFQYVLISKELVDNLPPRERKLISDAVALGSRLIVYNANSNVEIGGLSHPLKRQLSWHKLGFGQIAVNPLDLSELRKALAIELGERASEAYKFFRQGQSTDMEAVSWRSQMMSKLLGVSASRGYGWALTSGSGLLALNPIWAYDYVILPALAQPLQLRFLHWSHLKTQEVFREKNRPLGGPTKYAFPVALQRAFKGDSLRSLAAFIVCFSLALVAALGTLVWLRRSLLLIALVTLAICSFAGFLFIIHRIHIAPGGTEFTQLTFIKGSTSASVVEQESLLWFFQTGSQKVDFALPLRDLVVKRVSPLREDLLTTSVEQGVLAGLRQFSVNPFLVSEVTVRGVASQQPLFNLAVREREDGSRQFLLTNATGTRLHLVLLAMQGELLDLGPMDAEQEVTLLVPSPGSRRPSIRRVQGVREIVRSFHYATFNDSYYAFGRETAQPKADYALVKAALGTLVYELVADRDRIYVVAVGNRATETSVGGVPRAPTAASELILYNLQ
ncbi:MAG: hypothetical protein B1H03_02925 [Planctomycetales bacterium 4484_113]|nr:MAG: hypothetical protein B1H03_02925 [Planctomycetales bacterium 4484_113]